MPIKTGWWDASLTFCNLAKALKHNTICDCNSIQTHNHLVRKRTLNHFAKLAKWLTCVVSTYLYGIHLNFRYLFRGMRSLTLRELKSVYSLWDENMKHNKQGLHFLVAIKIIATLIHYCYYLMAYGKWRPVTWYRMINITFYFSV